MSGNRTNRPTHISSSWVRGVSGAYVCGKDHRDSYKQKSEELAVAVLRLKDKVPKEFVTEDDMDLVVNMCNNDNSEM